jgi:hypothetical protein
VGKSNGFTNWHPHPEHVTVFASQNDPKRGVRVYEHTKYGTTYSTRFHTGLWSVVHYGPDNRFVGEAIGHTEKEAFENFLARHPNAGLDRGWCFT